MSLSSSCEGQPRCLRILGVDPAAAGPTGYAVIEVLGRECRVLHYGALKVAPKRQKESAAAVLHAVHELLCGLIHEFKPQVMAVESVFISYATPDREIADRDADRVRDSAGHRKREDERIVADGEGGEGQEADAQEVGGGSQDVVSFQPADLVPIVGVAS